MSVAIALPVRRWLFPGIAVPAMTLLQPITGNHEASTREACDKRQNLGWLHKVGGISQGRVRSVQCSDCAFSWWDLFVASSILLSFDADINFLYLVQSNGDDFSDSEKKNIQSLQ